MGNMVNLAGRRFQSWSVIERTPPTPDQLVHWLCVCDCGRRQVIVGKSLISGNTKWCSCNRPISTITHGATRGKRGAEYRIWCGIKARCFNPNVRDFANYGGRGVTMCNAWSDSFPAFFAAVGPRQSPKHSIERDNNSLGYVPGNARWATRAEQSQNTRQNHRITAWGETKNIGQWSNDGRCVVCLSTIRKRLRRGFSPEDAISLPSHVTVSSTVTTDEIPAEHRSRLVGEGISSSWLGDKMGIGQRQAAKLLRAAGAIAGSNGRYFLPGTRPPYVAGKCSRRSESTGSVLETGRDRG